VFRFGHPLREQLHAADVFRPRTPLDQLAKPLSRPGADFQNLLVFQRAATFAIQEPQRPAVALLDGLEIGAVKIALAAGRHGLFPPGIGGENVRLGLRFVRAPATLPRLGVAIGGLLGTHVKTSKNRCANTEYS
jgi:hypothetical protein